MSSSLILLDQDPDDPSKTLVQCPRCNEIRSLKNHSIYGLKKKNNSLCSLCARKNGTHYCFKEIPQSEQCIVLEQIHGRWPGGTTTIVQCPICHKSYESLRGEIRHRNNTICWLCSRQLKSRHLETNEDCIVLKQFSSRNSHGSGYALVKCPACKLVYERRRDNISKTKHTYCSKCCRKGSRNPHWKGGRKRDYGNQWSFISSLIRSRDDHKCQYPGCAETSESQRRQVSVHHITPFLQTYNNSEFNLIALCNKHHLWADHNLNKSVPLFETILRLMYGPDYP